MYSHVKGTVLQDINNTFHKCIFNKFVVKFSEDEPYTNSYS